MKNNRFIKIRKNKLFSFMRHYVNGTKGVISLFLAILMVPFATIAGVLVNAARINSAVAIFDEALCNASNSTLGTYDSFLRERFGLLAMSQNTASNGTGYTVQELISDTFDYYMEQNLSVLSNTYTVKETSATGIYPLADTDILLSEVLEYGKYSVPTKLIIDGFSLDDILNSLTSSMSLVTSIFNTMSAGAGMVDKFSSCQEKLDALIDQIQACNTAEADCITAYNNFKLAVDNYNSLITEMEQKIQEGESAVNEAQNEINRCNTIIEEETEKYPEIISQLETLKNEKDTDGNPVDNSVKILEIENLYIEELKIYSQALEDLETAEGNLVTAETNVENTKSSYVNQLANKRTEVSKCKSEYISKIDVYAGAVLSAGNAVIAAQNSISAVNNAAVTLTSNMATTLYEGQKSSIDKQIEEMEKSKEDAEKRGDDEAVGLWKTQIDKAKENQVAIKNENTIDKALTSSTSTAISTLNDFSKAQYQSQFSELYSRIIELKTSVDKFVIPAEDVKMSSTDSYYLENFELPITSEQVQQMTEKLASEIAQSNFFAVLKALIGFIKALFSLSAWYDPELTATINTDYYNSSIGGLPSIKDRRNDSPYYLGSEYEEEDSAKSDYYKELLGAYSNEGSVLGSETTLESAIEIIMASLNTISGCFDNWHWYNIFSNLKTIAQAIGDIIGQVISIAGNIVQVMTTAIQQKALLMGYIAYNVPNRTTYTGSALTGKSYSLPNAGSPNQGYAFYGAEAEYIICGNEDEKKNQTDIFNTIYLIRLLFDVAFVAINKEVATIAGQAGAATFGIGTIVVYVLYILAEPLVDTLILVNGGNIPIAKMKLYLTPTGIPNLIEAFVHLKLTEAQKNKVYQEVTGVMKTGDGNTDFPEDFAGAKETFGPRYPKIVDSITFDYTKTLLIVMMFKNSNTLLDRLADVIQMESTYNAVANQIDTYVFDLDKSYTYLRVSGSFTTNEFIKISNSPGLTSTERIVYRGY